MSTQTIAGMGYVPLGRSIATVSAPLAAIAPKIILCRYIDPQTGDYVPIDGGYFKSASPITQAVIFNLLNKKGSVLGKPEIGIDFAGIDTAEGNEVIIQYRVREALSRLSNQIQINLLEIEVSGSKVSLTIDFSEINNGSNRTLNFDLTKQLG